MQKQFTMWGVFFIEFRGWHKIPMWWLISFGNYAGLQELICVPASLKMLKTNLFTSKTRKWSLAWESKIVKLLWTPHYLPTQSISRVFPKRESCYDRNTGFPFHTPSPTENLLHNKFSLVSRYVHSKNSHFTTPLMKIRTSVYHISKWLAPIVRHAYPFRMPGPHKLRLMLLTHVNHTTLPEISVKLRLEGSSFVKN